MAARGTGMREAEDEAAGEMLTGQGGDLTMCVLLQPATSGGSSGSRSSGGSGSTTTTTATSSSSRKKHRSGGASGSSGSGSNRGADQEPELVWRASPNRKPTAATDADSPGAQQRQVSALIDVIQSAKALIGNGEAGMLDDDAVRGLFEVPLMLQGGGSAGRGAKRLAPDEEGGNGGGGSDSETAAGGDDLMSVLGRLEAQLCQSQETLLAGGSIPDIGDDVLATLMANVERMRAPGRAAPKPGAPPPARRLVLPGPQHLQSSGPLPIRGPPPILPPPSVAAAPPARSRTAPPTAPPKFAVVAFEDDLAALMDRLEGSIAVPQPQRPVATVTAATSGASVPALPVARSDFGLSDPRFVRLTVMSSRKVQSSATSFHIELETVRAAPESNPTATLAVCIILQDQWAHTRVAVGNVLHLVFHPSPCPRDLGNVPIVVSGAQNAIVMHPDVIIAPTRLASSLDCMRKAVLDDWVSGVGNRYVLFGSLRHLLFEYAVSTGTFDEAALQQEAARLVRTDAKITDLYEYGLTEAEVVGEIINIIPSIQAWVAQHWRVPGTRGQAGAQSPSAKITELTNVISAEDTIVSPIWGLQGNIDVTVQARVHHRLSKSIAAALAGATMPSTEALLPLELKTGQPHISHHAQVAVYGLCMSDRFPSHWKTLPSPAVRSSDNIFPPFALLLYLNKQGYTMQDIGSTWHDMVGLLVRRNELASYLNDTQEVARQWADGRLPLDSEDSLTIFPPMCDDERTCRRCDRAQQCVILHSAVEKRSRSSVGGAETHWAAFVENMKPEHQAYIATWHRWLATEAAASRTATTDALWSLSGHARERAHRRCASALRLVGCDKLGSEEVVVVDGTKGGFLYTFRRVAPPSGVSSLDAAIEEEEEWAGPALEPTAASTQTQPGLPKDSLLRLEIQVGDYVSASFENGPFRVMSGEIVRMSHSEIVLHTRSSLSMISHRDAGDVEDLGLALPPGPYEALWRVDRIEYATVQRHVMDNVMRLFTGDAIPFVNDPRKPDMISGPQNGDIKTRAMVVELLAPRFGPREFSLPWDFDMLDASAHADVLALQREFVTLNSDQQSAVRAVMAARDYVCIQGMPGTGKTSTLAFIVRLLVAKGCSVLITSYTHTAVDNVLLKLIEAHVDLLRLGQVAKIHPDLAPYSLTMAIHNATIPNADALRYRADTVPVVATSCLGINHGILRRRRFDVCIVDEASQILEPACLGPLRCAHRFVLVGDHHQLPPLVSSPKARAAGMDVSLFKRLAEAHPAAVVSLGVQYRMNSDIQLISNTLIYNNALRCGSEAVANGRYVLPHLENVLPQRGAGDTAWLATALNPANSVVFLSTDPMGTAAQEHRQSAGTQRGLSNAAEAALVCTLVRSILRAGGTPADIGIITPYRAQVHGIQRLLSLHHIDQVEVDTVDRYQGRDKRVIIMSLVRCNPTREVGILVGDVHRINVACTRAKHKLVFVGSANTLTASPIFASLAELCTSHSWMHMLPEGAHLQHDSWAAPSGSPEECGSQPTAAAQPALGVRRSNTVL